MVDVCPAEDMDAPLSTDVEPASEKRDLESPVPQPITEQQATEAPPSTDQVTQFASDAS